MVGWLMSASRCKCRPRRPTYPTLTTVLKGISRSTVTFQFHASGLWNDLLCVVTVKGRLLGVLPPGLSTRQKEKIAEDKNGDYPHRRPKQMTPRRVKYR